MTIKGVNLGRDFNDVVNAVSTANVRCNVVRDEYVTASRIVCVTKESLHLKPASNPIIVKLKDHLAYTAISDANYEYVDPVGATTQPSIRICWISCAVQTITGFTPDSGPSSGGTDVTIRGQNLDAGSSVSALIANSVCAIISRSNEAIVCRTGPKTAEVNGHLKVVFDGAEKDFVNFQYRYECVLTFIMSHHCHIFANVQERS